MFFFKQYVQATILRQIKKAFRYFDSRLFKRRTDYSQLSQCYAPSIERTHFVVTMRWNSIPSILGRSGVEILLVGYCHKKGVYKRNPLVLLGSNSNFKLYFFMGQFALLLLDMCLSWLSSLSLLLNGYHFHAS